MSTSYPTLIRANLATKINAGINMATASYLQGIEKSLKDIIEKRCGFLLPEDRSVELDIDNLTNLEILMDLEEQVVGLHKTNPNEIDEEFKKCKTFNDMMKCVRKHLS